MRPLYELAAEYQAVLECAENGEDVVAALDRVTTEIEAKAVNVCRIIAQFDADAQAAGREAMRLSQRRAVAENNADRLRQYLKDCMGAAGIGKIKSPQFSITLSPGQDRVEVVNLEALRAAAPELVRTKTTSEADKPAILRRRNETGEIPPGVEFIPTTTLRVR